MKILKNNAECGNNFSQMVLTATGADDFYVLSNVLVKGDKIESKTTRKVSFDNKTQTKITTKIQIKIETITADLEYGILHVKGTVCKENEHVSIGSYHTLNIELNQKFVIEKDEWTKMDIRAIKDAAKDTHDILFVIFYEKECVITSFSNSNTRILSKHNLKNKNYKEIANTVMDVEKKFNTLIVASAYKSGMEFKNFLTKTTGKTPVLLQLSGEYKHIPNAKVISKIIVDPTHARQFTNVQHIEDLKQMQLFLNRYNLGNDKLLFVGFKELKEVFDYGALEKLFITDKLYRPSTVEKRRVIEKVIEEALSFRASIYVIPVENELGEQLDMLGGVAGTLLFEFK